MTVGSRFSWVFLAVLCASAASPAAQQAPATVLITGTNRGLGLEFTRQYAARGWNVIATARDPQSATELRELAGRNSRFVVEKLDVLDRAAIKTLAAKYKGRPIDLIINNAGVLGDIKSQALGALDYDEFEEVMAVNVYAPLAIAEAFRDHVAASGQKKIVSITSRSGIISLPGYRGPSFYRASKTALNMVTRVLADDLRDRGVIVAVISPPPTETDMLKQLIGAEGAARQAKPANVIAGLIKVIDGLTIAESGGAPIYFDGTTLPW
jgi:NAD(P)-dependent dehydrogenase (short-subunit alcohol dehydrogenase family)